MKIGSRNGMDLYGVPLVRLSGATAERYTFGKADAKQKLKVVLGFFPSMGYNNCTRI